jgi:hypothetical protein
VDQILPHHCDPVLYESYMKDARGYVKVRCFFNTAGRCGGSSLLAHAALPCPDERDVMPGWKRRTVTRTALLGLLVCLDMRHALFQLLLPALPHPPPVPPCPLATLPLVRLLQLAEKANGPLPAERGPAYPWGFALVDMEASVLLLADKLCDHGAAVPSGNLLGRHLRISFCLAMSQ